MNWIILLTGILLFQGCAGNISSVSTKEQEQSLNNKNIREFPYIGKDGLYNRSLKWAEKNYDSFSNTIQSKNPKKGQIICKGQGSYYHLLHDRHFNYTLIIDVKEGKVRTRIEKVSSQIVRGIDGPDFNKDFDLVRSYFIKLREKLYSSISDYQEQKN